MDTDKSEVKEKTIGIYGNLLYNLSKTNQWEPRGNALTFWAFKLHLDLS